MLYSVQFPAESLHEYKRSAHMQVNVAYVFVNTYIVMLLSFIYIRDVAWKLLKS